MDPMQVAFYKGRTRLFNRAVSWWLRGPYSHSELVLCTDRGVSCCASASFTDGGVRVKYMELDPSHWDLVDVQADMQAALTWIDQHKGQKYDVLGLFGFIWRRVTGDKRAWFCSEAVASMLGYAETWRFDPMTLWATLARSNSADAGGV